MRRLLLGLGFWVLVAPETARADRSFDLVPAPSAIDAYGLQVVDRAQTPQQFEFGMLAHLGWAGKPLRVELFDMQMGRQPASFAMVEHQATLDLGFYLGLWDFLSLAAVVPLGVNVYDPNAVGSPTVLVPPSGASPYGSTVGTGVSAGQPRQNLGPNSAGVRDPRFAVKTRFYGGRHFEIGALFEVTLPLGDSASFLGEPQFTFRPKLLFGVSFWRFRFIGNVGAVVRESSWLLEPNTPPGTEPPVRLTVGHELTFGSALTLRVHRVLGLGVEAVGTAPISQGTTFSTAALLGSLYFLPTDKLRFSLSGGSGLFPDNPRNPTGRVLLQMCYSLSPRAGGLL